MNLLVLLGIVVIGAIFTVQNMQAVPLYFLGNSAKTAVLTLSLPLSFWVLSFTLAGIATSLFLRSFLRSPRPAIREYPASPPKSPRFPASTSQSDWPAQPTNDWIDSEDVDSWFSEENAQPPSPENSPRDRVPTPLNAEWQSDLRQKVEHRPPQPDDDYFDSTPKSQVTDIRLDPQWQEASEMESPPEPSRFKLTYNPPPVADPPRQVTRPPATPPEQAGDSPSYSRSQFEVPQQPKSENRQGTIYSYTYKEPRDRKKAARSELSEGKPERVFDANYRLLNPPSGQPEDLPDESEEWI